ncbi:TPA: NTPase KAP [Vibrio vulnificus]|nr:NTPase KAP [Vibrio vulnificus]
MTQKIEMHWNKDETILGEHCPADKLDRAKYAQFLTSFLAGQGFDETKENNAQKKNYVLNLNSEWGSGKTYFLKRWYHALKPHYPVVYVDAWKQDYSDDPLMTVISSMIKQLREQAGKDADDPKFKVPRKAIGLLKAALPSAAGALAKRYLGIDPVAIMEAAAEGDVGEKITDAEGKEIDMGAAASKAVQYLLDEHDAKSEAIASLKTSVTQWIDAVNGAKKVSYPAFIFIDELDRCRPSYAVEMLETIKHIFDIPGVVFVVGTDTEQLQHTVRAIYGEGFDAMTYLGRFFNSRCTLRKPSFKDLQETHCDMHKLTDIYFQEKGIDVYPTTLNAIEELGSAIEIPFRNLTKVFEAFNLQARQVIQITNRLISIIDNLDSGVLVDVIFLTFLLCLKEKKPKFYDDILKNPAIIANLSAGSDREIYKFIYQDSEIAKIKINIDINPIDLVDEFYEDQHRRHKNRWESGYYCCTLLEYIKKVLNIIVNKSNIKFQIETETREAFNLQSRNGIQKSKANIWIAIEFARMQQKNGQSFDFYRNLVDLSSALDSVEINETD